MMVYWRFLQYSKGRVSVSESKTWHNNWSESVPLVRAIFEGILTKDKAQG